MVQIVPTQTEPILDPILEEIPQMATLIQGCPKGPEGIVYGVRTLAIALGCTVLLLLPSYR